MVNLNLNNVFKYTLFFLTSPLNQFNFGLPHIMMSFFSTKSYVLFSGPLMEALDCGRSTVSAAGSLQVLDP